MPRDFSAESLDDLMHAAIEAVLEGGETVEPTKGPNRELRGATLRLEDPRARLSRSESRGKVFSALGELLWYLSGSNATSHIAHYIPRYRDFDECGMIFGGYGPRLRGEADQLATVVRLLKEKPTTRRAVLQLFDHTDLLGTHQDVPCTCTIQFMNRNGRLDAMVFMRSNDVFIGLPHDVFCFTMIQEIVARSIGVDVGLYVHAVGSLHLYNADADEARHFLEEGFYANTPMPAMPSVDPAGGLSDLLAFEAGSRAGLDPLEIALPTTPYWADLARLLMIFELDRCDRIGEIDGVVSAMTSDVYGLYVADRIHKRTCEQ